MNGPKGAITNDQADNENVRGKAREDKLRFIQSIFLSHAFGYQCQGSRARRTKNVLYTIDL